MISLFILIINYNLVTDKRTDKRTDERTDGHTLGVVKSLPRLKSRAR